MSEQRVKVSRDAQGVAEVALARADKMNALDPAMFRGLIDAIAQVRADPAVRAVVLPGEVMNVFILKEGKEHNQGVAYLDDGTMVVVDNARSRIGRNLDVVVTSVLQTTAGRMIFGKHVEPAQGESQASRSDDASRRPRPAASA